MSSDLAMLVSSSIEIWLSSQIIRRLPSFWCPAMAAASWLMPSSMSPSEANTYTLWSNGLSPWAASGSNRPRRRRDAHRVADAFAERGGGCLEAQRVGAHGVHGRERGALPQLIESAQG